MRLLDRRLLVKTSGLDQADWNYRFPLGYIQRQRFRLARNLLRPRHYPRLLEVGYGSGVFLPELATHCDALFGLDVHPARESVAEAVGRLGIHPALYCGSTEDLPFEAEAFDGIVAVSTIEFVEDLDAACAEIRRVLRPDGILVVVTPGSSKLVDFGLKLLTGRSARTGFGDRRRRVLPALTRHFQLKVHRIFPPLYVPGTILYHALKLQTPCTHRKGQDS